MRKAKAFLVLALISFSIMACKDNNNNSTDDGTMVHQNEGHNEDEFDNPGGQAQTQTDTVSTAKPDSGYR